MCGVVRPVCIEIRGVAGRRSRLSRSGAAVQGGAGGARCSGLPPAFDRVIDLGCGTGLAARAFAAVAGEIIGIDLSPRMIERARLTGLYAELEVAEIVQGLVRQPDASADLILAADVMVYVHDMAPLLAEVARVLAPRRTVRVYASKAIRARAWCWVRGCATLTARPAREC